MDRRTALRLGRSHFIFIAALLAGSALIFAIESHDPDGWGRTRTQAYQRALAGAGNWRATVSTVATRASAEAICAEARRQGAACLVQGPAR